MDAQQYIMNNPYEVTIVIGALFGLVVLLMRLLAQALTKMVTTPYTLLTQSIKTLDQSICDITKELKTMRRDFREARDKDRAHVARIDLRMTAIETRCKLVHDICPHTRSLEFEDDKPTS
jgi:hypothetical protein